MKPISLLALLAVSVAALAGCSSGPQLPVVTVPVTVSCTWHENACPSPSIDSVGRNGAVHHCDCLVDRSTGTADAVTTGNQVEADIAADVRANVSAAAPQ